MQHGPLDAWAGLAAMLVALPSAIAFGVTIYAPLGGSYAAYGALAGILGTTALGLVASSLGGTERLITAPCAPAAAVLAALAVQLTATGTPAQTVVTLLTVIALLTGLLQVGFGFIGLGRLIKYMPYPVVSGYLSGVGLIIITSQVPKLFVVPQSVVVGLVTIAAMLIAPKLTRRVPAAIIGLLAGVAAYFSLAAFDHSLLAMRGNHLVIGPIGASGAAFFQGLQARAGTIGHLTSAQVASIVMPALTLTVLLSIDTLKTCLVVDTITRTRHDSNKELIGQGCGNVASAFVGGVPGAGTMGATLVNITSGAQTRMAGIIEGALALVVFLAFANLVAWIPVATLAGILIVVGFRMLDRNSLSFLRSRSTILDFAVIAAVVVTALTVSLIMASGVGIALAIMLFIREQIRGSIVHRKLYGNETFSKRARLPWEMSILREHGGQAAIFELQGSLFFGTADQLYRTVEQDLLTKRWIVLDMRRVQSVDVTAVHTLEQIEAVLRDHKGKLLFTSVSRHPLIDAENEFPELDDALEVIEDAILAESGMNAPEQKLLELSDMSLFEGRNPYTLAALQECMAQRSFAAGEKIFALDDTGEELYLIRAGSVRIMLPISDDLHHHISTFGRGDFFGEMAFLDHAPRSADAIAFTDTHVFVLSRGDFDAFADQHLRTAHVLLDGLARALAIRLRHTNAELTALEK